MTRFSNLVEALNAAPDDRVFVTSWIDEDEREEVTFGEFRSRARRQADLLSQQGVSAGDRVVIIMPSGILAMTTFAGAMMLGAVPAILAYPNFKIEPAKYRLGLTGVTANLSAKVVVIDEGFPDEMLGHVALTDGSKLLRSGYNNGQDNGLEHSSFAGCRPENIAFIQHSAGTTGLQKGVALTHAAVLIQLEHLAQRLRINPASDRLYSWLPLYHDMGLISCFMLPMVYHLPVVMQSPLDWVVHPETMLQLVSDYKCTLAWLPNFAFQFVARRVRSDRRYDLSSVRALINCSEPVRTGSMSEFHRTFAASGFRSDALQSCYAMAENVFAVSQSDVTAGKTPKVIWADGPRFREEQKVLPVPQDTPGAVPFTSSGRLLPNHELRIVSQTAEPLPDGHVGEILITSDCLFQGYYNRPDLTAEVLVNGWYRTGDLGFQQDGELYVAGRKKDLIIVGGENLYPQDIEQIVDAHAAIHDGRAVALGLYNPELGTEEITVVAELEREELLSQSVDIEREIRCRVVESLGIAVRNIYLKPPAWIVKSTAGKPARSATRDKLLREHPQLGRES